MKMETTGFLLDSKRESAFRRAPSVSSLERRETQPILRRLRVRGPEESRRIEPVRSPRGVHARSTSFGILQSSPRLGSHICEPSPSCPLSLAGHVVDRVLNGMSEQFGTVNLRDRKRLTFFVRNLSAISTPFTTKVGTVCSDRRASI